MKKYNEKMIIRNGKMIYAIGLKDKSDSSKNRNHIIIENGKVYFSDSWYSDAVEFNFNDEAHKIAKEIFISQLQVDIKRRVLELKQLEEIFADLNLSECFGNVLVDNTKRILELENKVNNIKEEVNAEVKEAIEEVEEKISVVKEDITEAIDDAIEEQVRPIARKKKEVKNEQDN